MLILLSVEIWIIHLGLRSLRIKTPVWVSRHPVHACLQIGPWTQRWGIGHRVCMYWVAQKVPGCPQCKRPTSALLSGYSLICIFLTT